MTKTSENWKAPRHHHSFLRLSSTFTKYSEYSSSVATISSAKIIKSSFCRRWKLVFAGTPKGILPHSHHHPDREPGITTASRKTLKGTEERNTSTIQIKYASFTSNESPNKHYACPYIKQQLHERRLIKKYPIKNTYIQ